MAEKSGRIELDFGYVLYGGNEITIVSTVEDPPKLRFASAAGLSLGAFSFNRLRPDGGQTEMVLFQGKQDERFRNDPNNPTAEMTIHLNNGGDQDSNMVPVMELRHDGVRIKGINW